MFCYIINNRTAIAVLSLNWDILKKSSNLHRVYPLPSCHGIDPLSPGHWRNHSDRAGTQGTNRQEEQVVQSAIRTKTNKEVKTAHIEKKVVLQEIGTVSIKCLFDCLCVCVCVFR